MGVECDERDALAVSRNVIPNDSQTGIENGRKLKFGDKSQKQKSKKFNNEVIRSNQLQKIEINFGVLVKERRIKLVL